MQNTINNAVVQNDVKTVYDNNFDLINSLKNSTVLVTGANGLIGSFFVKTLLYANSKSDLNIKILALVRNKKKGKACFENEPCQKGLKLLVQDITKPIKYRRNIDYIIHCAANTASKSFVDYPVETLNVSVEGTKNILEFAKSKKVKSLIYLSSMEVYGELEADRGLTKEEDLGYIDILRPRSSYQMGKRIAESYCAYYAKEHNVPVKIARLAQIVSSNVQYDDPRVYALFARCIVEKKDIVLNTPADIIRSFCYVTDAISGLLTILLKGSDGEPYNVGNETAILKIKELAQKLCEKHPSSALKFEILNIERYPTTTTNWQLSTEKLNHLGWKAKISLEEMFDRLINSFTKAENIKNTGENNGK